MTIYMIFYSDPDYNDNRYRTTRWDEDYGYFIDKESAERFAQNLQETEDQVSRQHHEASENSRKAYHDRTVKEISVLIENGLRTLSALPGPFERREWHRPWDSTIYTAEAIEPHE